jgi:tRNA (adenine-N(1)-)-methyltransferase non-catalytic subunit
LSFEKKTDYSKEKYLKKKKNKYLAVYQIVKPTYRLLCEFYMQDMLKRKVLNLRIDMLAQILTYANIAANRNTIVLESCKGLIVAGVAERMGGKKKLVENLLHSHFEAVSIFYKVLARL